MILLHTPITPLFWPPTEHYCTTEWGCCSGYSPTSLHSPGPGPPSPSHLVWKCTVEKGESSVTSVSMDPPRQAIWYAAADTRHPPPSPSAPPTLLLSHLLLHSPPTLSKCSSPLSSPSPLSPPILRECLLPNQPGRPLSLADVASPPCLPWGSQSLLAHPPPHPIQLQEYAIPLSMPLVTENQGHFSSFCISQTWPIFHTPYLFYLGGQGVLLSHRWISPLLGQVIDFLFSIWWVLYFGGL